MRPRIRTIKPEFFGSRTVNSMSIGARYTAIGMLSAADDRGRLEHLLAAIRGHVFPKGDVTERRLAALIGETLQSQFALAYEADGWSYLWLPGFWRHQVINRPTESSLPPHPSDPYGEIPIVDALREFREDSLSDQGGLTPSRAGARSVPVPTSLTTSRSESTAVVTRATKRVDQTALPGDFPEAQRDLADRVLELLTGVQSELGGNAPTLRGVGLALVAFPDRDHLSVARELQHWTLAGTGQSRHIRDFVRLYRTFLERAPIASAARNGNGHRNGWRNAARPARARRDALIQHD